MRRFWHILSRGLRNDITGGAVPLPYFLLVHFLHFYHSQNFAFVRLFLLQIVPQWVIMAYYWNFTQREVENYG